MSPGPRSGDFAGPELTQTLVDRLQDTYPTIPRRVLALVFQAGYWFPEHLAQATAADLGTVNGIGPHALRLLCQGLNLAPPPESPDAPGLSELDLVIMAARPRAAHVPRLVAEVRRLRAILDQPRNGGQE